MNFWDLAVDKEKIKDLGSIEAGCDGFISKPIVKEELLKLITDFTQSSL